MAGITRDTSVYTKAYTSFSGADITCFVNGGRVWQAQSVSYSITREKAPVYVLGSSNPLCFSRGKRGIAGSLIFSSNANDAMGTLLNNSEYAAKDTDLAHFLNRPQGGGTMSDYVTQNAARGNVPEDSASVMAAQPIYYDQLLPFDVVIMASNEYFQLAQMVIYGIEILTVGSGLSIDDTSNETQMSYVALHITKWVPRIRPGDPYDFDQVVGFNPGTAQQTFGEAGFTD